MPGEVIPSRVYVHTSGRRASPYGSAPWLSDAGKAEWTLVDEGFTVRHPDGTIGLGRKPFTTAEEAQAWVDAHPRFPGMSQG